MRFKDFYFGRFVGGVEPEVFKDILSGFSEDNSVSVINNGSMLLKPANKIIKCVSNYYKPVGREGAKTTSSQNVFLRCQVVRGDLDIHCERIACRTCHGICMDKLRQGTLERK